MKITQNGDKMSSTALISLHNNAIITISYLRLYGFIHSNGISARGETAMLIGRLGADLNVHNIGFFGGFIN